MTSPSNRKRPLPTLEDQTHDPQDQDQPQRKQSRTSRSTPSRRRSTTTAADQEGLLTELTGVLDAIRSTPSSGEIPAESLETLKTLMLQIEHLSSDSSNTEARNMKHESERQLELWFDDLLEQCEADGGLDLDYLMDDTNDDGASDDEEDALALALALMDEEEQEREEQDVVSPQHPSDTGSDTTAQEIDVVA
ncbi:hypothetical protein BDA99DRAFT_526540 [Phascolomyces articulosus]|uniref:Uncharacterized protein n=1 Tax=Phascolomyces articulosus TaxID=60185 RepID=A0AAD5JXV0_9FUNG|nr:hypothetical protein BDA99DRAFT_526540 [Phascolomyces articulosus]